MQMNSSPIRFAGCFTLALTILLYVCVIRASSSSTAIAHETASTIQSESTAEYELENRPIPPSSEPRIRVRLRSEESGSTLTFGEEGQRLLCLDQLDSRVFLRPAPLQVTRSLDGWDLIDGDQRRDSVFGSGILTIRTLEDDDSKILFEGGRLPGFVDLVPRNQSDDPTKPERLDVIVHLSLESYLPGVLDVELYGHWPLETFMAQAVAARSYAVAESAFWADRRHFDVVAGPRSQGWSGDGGSEKARDAVQSTTGMLLLQDGRVIPAYYSAACGGFPASANDAISSRPSHRISSLVPLDARPRGCCENSSVFKWSMEFKRADIDRLIQEWRNGVDGDSELPSMYHARFVGLSVFERSPNGRPLIYRLTFSDGTTSVIDAEVLRRMLSTLSEVGEDQAKPLRSSVFSGRLRGRRFRLDGLGWGHGCGLCQYGANAMGEDGFTWRQILDRFYPGSEVRSFWRPNTEMVSAEPLLKE